MGKIKLTGLFLIVLIVMFPFSSALSAEPMPSSRGEFCHYDSDCVEGFHCSGQRGLLEMSKCCPENFEYNFYSKECTQGCVDNDGDGFGLNCIVGEDCENNEHDDDALINPGMLEICDHEDNDCDGDVDEDCVKQQFILSELYGSARLELCDGKDNDDDGRVDEGCTNTTICHYETREYNNTDQCNTCGGGLFDLDFCTENVCSSLGDCNFIDNFLWSNDCLPKPKFETVEICETLPQCQDGILNGYEEGIDCGGNCGECDNNVLIKVEDASQDTTVNKLVGDFLHVNIFSNTEQTIAIDWPNELIPINCENKIHLDIGNNTCQFVVSDNVGSYNINYNNQSLQINIILEAESVYITDKSKLFKRFGEDQLEENSTVYALLESIYKDAEGLGIVYYLDNYISGHPWDSLDSYDPNHNPIEYVMKVNYFVRKKCAGNCKETFIVGDDFVVPYSRGSEGILTDDVYIQNTAHESAISIEKFLSEKIIILVPDQMNEQTNRAVGYLSELIDEKYISAEIEKASKYADNPYILANRNIIVVGNSTTNDLLKYARYSSNLPDSISLDRSPFGDYKYSLILNLGDEEYPFPVYALQKMVINGTPPDWSVFNVNFIVACVLTGNFKGDAISKGAQELTCNLIPFVELAPDIRDTYDCLVAGKLAYDTSFSEECTEKTADFWLLKLIPLSHPAFNVVKGSMCSADSDLAFRNAICPLVYVADVVDVIEAVAIVCAVATAATGAGVPVAIGCGSGATATDIVDAPASTAKTIKSVLEVMNQKIVIGFLKNVIALPTLLWSFMKWSGSKVSHITLPVLIRIFAKASSQQDIIKFKALINAHNAYISEDAFEGLFNIIKIENEGVEVLDYKIFDMINENVVTAFKESNIEDTLGVIRKETGKAVDDLKIAVKSDIPTSKLEIGQEIKITYKFEPYIDLYQTARFNKYVIDHELAHYLKYKLFEKTIPEILSNLPVDTKVPIIFTELDDNLRLLKVYRNNKMLDSFVSFVKGFDIEYKSIEKLSESFNVKGFGEVAAYKAQAELVVEEIGLMKNTIKEQQSLLHPDSLLFKSLQRSLNDLDEAVGNIKQATSYITDTVSGMAKQGEITAETASNFDNVVSAMKSNTGKMTLAEYEDSLKAVSNANRELLMSSLKTTLGEATFNNLESGLSVLKSKGLLLESEQFLDDIIQLLEIKGITKIIDNAKDGKLGFVFEARAARILMDNDYEIGELERLITTSIGNTDIDALMKNGNIFEMKQGWGTLSKQDVNEWNKQTADWGTKIAKFKRWSPNSKITFIFDTDVTQDVTDFLTKRDVLVMVIKDGGIV